MRAKDFINENLTIKVPASDTGPDIADLQKVLVAAGYELPKFGIDGIKKEETEGAIRSFQKDNGLSETGEFDQDTVEKMTEIMNKNPQKFNLLTASTTADVKKLGEINMAVIQDPDFNEKLKKIATALGVDAKDLLTVMKFESNVNPSIVNSIGATGLIQFMPATARNLGTTTTELRKMSAVEQLDYVYKFYKSVGLRPGSDLGTIYMYTFMPARANDPDDTVISSRGNKVYDQNPSLDYGRDGILTVGDVKNRIRSRAV